MARPKAKTNGDEVLTTRRLNRAILARQGLLARESVKPLAMIERLVGLQAQWPKPPFLGLWTRLEDFARDDLASLARSRNVVRATTARGTIHLLSAKDYLAQRPVFHEMFVRAVGAVLRERLKQMPPPETLVGPARAFFGEAPRTFTELRAHLQAMHPKADDRAMGLAVRLHVPLVLVPNEASPWAYPGDADFALADAWLKKPVATEGGDLGALVLRYLAAFGPATPMDMQTWSGLRNLGPAFDALRSKLVTFRDDKKRELFDLPSAPRPDEDAPAPVRFLPEFENVLLGYADRRRIVAVEHKPKVFLPALRVAGTFTVDGFVAGTWTQARKKDAATITLAPFAKLSTKDKRETFAEAEALLRFLEPDAETFDVKS